MLKNNRISTDVYSKQTDTPRYLDSKSCHPTHVKSGISYGQALRIRRIYDSDEVFKERLKEREGNLVKRGFSEELEFRTSFRKRFNNHRSSLVRYKKGQRGIPGEHFMHIFMKRDTKVLKI